jgi:peptidoglycan/LPS O-acetylase OafA/YrhL
LNSARIHFLDSTRGLAAFIVLLAHFHHAILPGLSQSWIFKSPLVLLFDADSAVLYFFLLSGYVLTRSVQNEPGKLLSYFKFIIRRLLRIFPAFIFAFFLMYIVLIKTGKPSSGWLSAFWQQPIQRLSDLWPQLILIKRIPNDPMFRILPHDWTLSIEIAVSLLLPALAIVARVNSFLLLAIVYFAIKFLGLDPFVFDFSLGIFIAIHRENWRLAKGKWLLLSGSVFLIGIGQFFPSEALSTDHLLIHHQTWGLAGLLILLLNSQRLQKFLSLQPFVFLGKISYSFYLLHLVILLIMINLFSSINSVAFLIILALSTTITATISYFYIEKPFIRLSHKLTAAKG